MTEAIILLLIVAALSLALSLNSVFLPSSAIRRIGAIGGFIGIVVAMFAAQAELLGRPLPTSWARWRAHEEVATVLYAAMREGRSIYLYVQFSNDERPTSLELPWDEATARSLQDAINGGERGDGQMMMRWPFQKSWEDRSAPMFYNLPQPKLPDKPAPEKPLEYRRI